MGGNYVLSKMKNNSLNCCSRIVYGLKINWMKICESTIELWKSNFTNCEFASRLHSLQVVSFRSGNVSNREPDDHFYHVLFPSSNHLWWHTRTLRLCIHRLRFDRQHSWIIFHWARREHKTRWVKRFVSKFHLNLLTWYIHLDIYHNRWCIGIVPKTSSPLAAFEPVHCPMRLPVAAKIRRLKSRRCMSISTFWFDFIYFARLLVLTIFRFINWKYTNALVRCSSVIDYLFY